MGISKEALIEATRLTRQGRLGEATRAIQQALGLGFRKPPTSPDAGVLDVLAREVPRQHAQRDLEFEAPQGTTQPASFASHAFAFEGQRYRYRLFVPERTDGELLPLVVMLHGCKQDSEDFARGTGMNAVAARERCLVLYPEQLRKANGMGCWNWFETAHQRRGTGEPAMVAALVQATLAAHGGDPARVYVAGLSAGGALAASLGELYPDVFAAVGVHSGLPPGSAHDVQSAFTAMRKGTAVPTATARAVAMPTIIFHGSGDRTVAPANGTALVQRQLAARAQAPLEHSKRPEGSASGRSATCEQWTDAEGKVLLESWKVAGGPHAWSGGDRGGSFTDPQGPSASEAMLRFFLTHRKE
jgi:poly(hydroxyalkanoate) depolymerase family esterase